MSSCPPIVLSVEQIRAEKCKLASDIQELLTSFTNRTGLYFARVTIPFIGVGSIEDYFRGEDKMIVGHIEMDFREDKTIVGHIEMDFRV